MAKKSKVKIQIVSLLLFLLFVLLSTVPFIKPISNTLRYFGIVKEKSYDDYITTASLNETELAEIVNLHLLWTVPTEEVLDNGKNLWIWNENEFRIQVVANIDTLFYDIVDIPNGIEYQFECKNHSNQLINKEECVISEDRIRYLKAYDYAQMQRDNEYTVYSNFWMYLISIIRGA